MNYEELQREVKSIIMDQSPSILLSVPDYINEAIQQIADEIDLPTLKTIFSLITSDTTYYTNIPATFSGRLRYVGDGDVEYKPLDGGIEELLRLHPDITETGDIEDIALEGNILYHLPIPTTVKTFYCVGFNKPSTLVNNTDTPTDIPDFLHREVICNKAVALAYNVIEDGIENEKVNTAVFEALSKRGEDKLRTWVTRRRSPVGRSCWSC